MADAENKQLVGMVIDCAKLTPDIFAKAIEDMIKNISNKNPQGKTSLSKLAKLGKIENIEVTDKNIGSFSKTARKYNLTYALKRIQTEDGKKQYLVCFNSKSSDKMLQAFKEYAYNQTHKKETLFSKKKVAAIQVETPEKSEKQRQRDKKRDQNISI